MNIKNNIKKVLFFASITIFMWSCTEDLNIIPNDDQTTLSEELFKDEDAYKEVLAGIYANFSLTGTDGAESSNLDGLDAGTSQYGRTLLYLQTLAADQMIWSYENDQGVAEIQRNTWNAQNPIILGMYERARASVNFVNNFLNETTPEKLDSRNVSDATRQEIVNFRAEARLVRALAYYHLMDLFGKVSFSDENSIVNTPPEEASRSELFTFIESELKAIEADLIDPRQNEYGRADKAVAWMILAKIYLNAEVYIGSDRYTECIEYCNKILTAGYTLAPNYLDLFKADNDQGAARNEIIFAFISDGSLTQNFGPTTVMTNGAVGSIEKNGDALGVTTEGWGGALRVRAQFANLFNGGAFITDTRNTLTKAGRTVTITDIADRDSGFILAKYSNITSAGVAGGNQTFVDTDFPLFRLADVNLMYAEAVLRGGSGGSIGEAIKLVNDLRTRANNPQAITATDLTLDFVIDERARELHWEAHRRQDLIRFNRFTGGNYNWAWKGNATNGIALPNHFDLYPIPASALAPNPNLTQNPGY
ncbi:RagB/SusD family nutrient uptake outer membrane protein [Tenacibaculum jejuense]|uniref:Probable lipoprotein, SusD/RagB family n=1 Tax=Tenacibaculum jejuense TaxID=584609 RepID=A0A238U9Q2_9FLAO|nr:RagB/SusD family nutrient uptake outer membrane protein [Tenacibaculum jejuense]SNR15832.1 Probable lipoprotein precursor, SusD/RagB family [Tenacibaculum jejuense]